MDIIKGKFVSLIPLEKTHAELTLGWRHSLRANLLNKGAETIEEQLNWINSRPKSEQNYMIGLKGGELVGMLSLIKIDKVNKNAESARFLIGENEKVKGIPVAVEAMKLLYIHAFETLGLVRVYGSIASNNKLMIKWQKFMGMKEEGRLRKHYFINNEFQDAVSMGILKEEFYKVLETRFRALLR